LLLFDPLSVFFLIIILTISIPSFIYSFGYLKGHYSGRKILLGHLLFALFVLSLLLVVSAGNIFFFLIAWELMSFCSYFLVVFDSENKKSITAGTIYMIMSQIGTALLIVAFLLMYKYAGSFDFNAVKAALSLLPAKHQDILFLLLFFGFGAKAGIVPLHIWLPFAHPQAPSHISALMSGVMIKTAIYGMIRFIILTLGVNSLWWGELVIVFACLSCLVGIIYALMEKDLKTLLAYSSVENIGIILLGVGGSMMFLKLGYLPLALLAMCAGLYHLINHAVFKGLLFLCAGSVYRGTGTRNIEKLGGLIKKMPWTSSYFLLGSIAISALPPLNGFISEWLTLMVFFLGALTVAGGIKLFFGLAAAALALTSGLAAACFVKAFGITFLARPRSAKAENAKECGLSMNIGMGILGVLVVFLGLGAVYVVKLLVIVSGSALGIEGGQIQLGSNMYLPSPFLPLLLIFFLGLAFVLQRSRVSTNQTWDCGYYKLTPRNEYTATAFSKPFRRAFGFFLRPYRTANKSKDSHYHIKTFSYETHTTKIFTKYLYKNLLGWIFGLARNMRGIQTGSIHIYLGYIFLTLLLLLVFMGRY